MNDKEIASLIYVCKSWLPILLLMAVWGFFVIRRRPTERTRPAYQQDDMEWWHKHKALRTIAYAVWGTAIVSWFPMAYIETAALQQPDHPVGEYSEPMHVKGVVRYVTPSQKLWDDVAQVGFFGGIASFFVAALIRKAMEKK